MENGSGPVFMNCAENTPEDTEFMMKSFYSEGDTGHTAHNHKSQTLSCFDSSQCDTAANNPQ